MNDSYVGKLREKEIDFVAEKDGERIYVQVVYMLYNDKVIHREFGNLVEVKDNFPKYVVSMDELKPRNTHKGIKHVHLREFLLSKL